MHKQSEEAQVTADQISKQNKALTAQLEALKSQLKAAEHSQIEQYEQNKTLLGEINSLKAARDDAKTVAVENQELAEQLKALKAQIEAGNASLKKQTGMNQALMDQLQLMRVECASLLSPKQRAKLTVYILDMSTYLHRDCPKQESLHKVVSYCRLKNN